MVKRSKNKKKAKMNKNSESNNQIRYLETLLKYSLVNVNGKSEELDSLFTNQANRIKAQIKNVKENQ